MDIETFSTTYWYIWFLAVLLIVILLIINGAGMLLYRKKRQQFLNKSNRRNENISMSEISSVSTINMNKSKYRQMSSPSTITSDSSYTNTIGYRSFFITNAEQTKISVPNMETIRETTEFESEFESESTSTPINEKNDMDLELEEFQRQALKEHNSIRAMFNKPPLKLTESLNIYAQHWAEQCAQMNKITPSRLEWRLSYKGQPLGEIIVSTKSTKSFDGSYFTSLIMANHNQSHEIYCLLNEISTEVGFGRAQTQSNDDTQQKQWIGVAHYYPYRQLTTVQS